MLYKIVLEFETEKLADEFWGWYLDGGGGDTFCESVETPILYQAWAVVRKTIVHKLVRRGGL